MTARFLDRLIEQAEELSADLANLPLDIERVKAAETEARLILADAKRKLEEAETIALARAGGPSALGKNDADRKHAAAIITVSDEACRRAAAEARGREAEFARFADIAEDYSRRFLAAQARARLHAALLNFLSSAGPDIALSRGGAPGPEVVSEADAASLGL